MSLIYNRVLQIARFSDCNELERWRAVKRIFRNLKGTLSEKYSSIEHPNEFTDQLKSLQHLINGEGVVYKSLHQRLIKETDVCVVTGLVDPGLAR